MKSNASWFTSKINDGFEKKITTRFLSTAGYDVLVRVIIIQAHGLAIYPGAWVRGYHGYDQISYDQMKHSPHPHCMSAPTVTLCIRMYAALPKSMFN